MFSFPRKNDHAAEAAACHQRGVDFLKDNNLDRSLAELRQAVDLDPGNARYWNSLGTTRKAAGDLSGAEASYRKSVEMDAAYTAPLYNLALLLRESDRPQEAEQCFRRLHALDPKDTDVLFHLGHLLAARSVFDEAMHMYEKALQLTPDNPYIWLYMGCVCHSIPERIEEAARCLQKCLALQPDLADAHIRLGAVYKQLSRLDEAMQCYRTAIKLGSGQPHAHYGLADILYAMGLWDDAIASYMETVRIDPGFAQAYDNIGCALIRKGQPAEAIGYFKRATAAQPEAIDPHFNLGVTYSALRKHDLAQHSFAAALRIDPNSAAAKNGLLCEMQHVCDWSRFDELVTSYRESINTHPDQTTDPHSLLSLPSTAAEQLQRTKNYVQYQLHEAINSGRQLEFNFERNPHARLKIGYLSADYREHATTQLLTELIELHDHTQFEIIGYSIGADDNSEVRNRIMGAFDAFADIRALSHIDAAKKIFHDEIDILVDLKGYTEGARTQILAMHPAPVQVNYLGYPGTMGADFMHYIISDRIITPPGHAAYYTEKLVLLPGSYQVNDRKRRVGHTPSRAVLGLPDSGIVFCCFNHNYKIMPPVFSAWLQLLQRTPGSVLWLLESNAWAAENLRREAARHGAGSDRLIFAPLIPMDQHLARLRAADLFLDTSPCGAHTTASDALWVGLPVITCIGETFASRVAASLLHAVGLPELVTNTVDEYVNLATRLAHNPADLAAIKERLSTNRATAPLFDTPLYARNLESAYQKMWENHISGRGPQPIYL